MKRFLFFFSLFMFYSGWAFAGILETIKSVASAESLWIGLGTVVLLFIFKKIPNDAIQNIVGKLARFLGRAITVNLSKFKFTAPFWASVIEPWVIDLIDNTFATFARELIIGLRTDNKNE